MVEHADPALLLHQRVDRRVVRLGREVIADELVAGVVFPLRQAVEVEDVHVTAIGDHAPLDAVDAEEAGVRGVVVRGRGQARLEQRLGRGRIRRRVGAGGAVEHVVVFGRHQEVAVRLRLHHRVGLGRTAGAGLRILRAGAGRERAAAVAVVGLAVQVAVVDRVRQRAGGHRRIPADAATAPLRAVRQRVERRHARRRHVADHHVVALHDFLVAEQREGALHAIEQGPARIRRAVHGGHRAHADGVETWRQGVPVAVAAIPFQRVVIALLRQSLLADPTPDNDALRIEDFDLPRGERVAARARIVELQVQRIGAMRIGMKRRA